MKKLFAGAGKLAGIVGIKTTEMRDFLKNISEHIDVRKETFTNQAQETITYDNYEVVKALAYYESYQQELNKMATKTTTAAVQNTVLPEIDVNEDEIPF